MENLIKYNEYFQPSVKHRLSGSPSVESLLVEWLSSDIDGWIETDVISGASTEKVVNDLILHLHDMGFEIKKFQGEDVEISEKDIRLIDIVLDELFDDDKGNYHTMMDWLERGNYTIIKL